MHTIYIKLNNDFSLDNLNSQLFDLGIFGEIYIYIEDLKHFHLLVTITEEIIRFLKQYTFCQIRLHVIHPYTEGFQSIYATLYQLVNSFNLEGYTYQITPRLIIFPLIISPPLENISTLFRFLESYFMPPGVIVDKEARAKIKNIERLFLHFHPNLIISVGYQNYLINLLENMRLVEQDWSHCPDSVVIDGKNVFPCIRAYEKQLFYLSDNICDECRYELLKKSFDIGLLTQAELAHLHFRLGLDLFEQEKIEMALKHFYETLQFATSDDRQDVYYYIGLCKAQLGEYDSAIECLQKANIANHNAYFYLGFSYFQKGDYLKAKENLEKALMFTLPSDEKLMIVIYLGHVYKELKMYKDAIILCKEMAKITQVQEIYNLMGTCYYKLEQYEKAADCFKNAILLDPSSAIDYANLCLSLKALNRKDEALVYCQRALELEPNLEFAQKALKELKSK